MISTNIKPRQFSASHNAARCPLSARFYCAAGRARCFHSRSETPGRSLLRLARLPTHRDLCGARRIGAQRSASRLPADDRGRNIDACAVRCCRGPFVQSVLPRPLRVGVLCQETWKNGVKLVSITQEMGDDPMHVMMRQIMALFDEYQSKENAKHVIRALKENARQCFFWNGSLPPIGYRVVAAEQRGRKPRRGSRSIRCTLTR
jgi:hypothetical protein